jgi:ABC-2 type transport system ATP-binding protein
MAPVVSLESLAKSYGDKQVLAGLDLAVEPGRILAYLGPNGAGKSTTIKILLGIVRDFEGRARVFGEDPAAAGPELRRRIGYVPETPELYDALSGEEHLGFLAAIHRLPVATARSRAREMAELLQLSDALSARVSSYSKGMKQKLMIIASLLHDPELLFWDEPLSGLDASTALVVKELMAELARRGKTIFYSSHVMEVVEKVSDRIVILDRGRIVADGSFAELRGEDATVDLEAIFNAATGEFDQAGRALRIAQAMRSGSP